jgi:two-component system LytT family sensor kinase
MKQTSLTDKKMRILLHLLAWTILFVLPVYFIQRWHIGEDFIWLYYINTIISGIIFYANYLLLIPKLFFNSKKLAYYFSLLILLAIFYFVSDHSNKLVFRYKSPTHTSVKQSGPSEHDREISGPPRGGRSFGRQPFRQMHLYNYTFTFLSLTIFALGLRALERQGQIEKRQKELEKEKLNSELALLKNQISPHFFFNTLNNIYSLIIINTEDSQNAVLKLSRLMRYLLYESEQGQTTLSSDIDFMKNYIDLMRLRMSNKVNLHVEFPSECASIHIPPLLFIPFVENAFKYGISYREKSFIDIRMSTTKDLITFRCSNSIVKPVDDSASQHSGIGLENVSKRLNLLFPGKHELKINESASSFDVILNISLKST